MISSFGRISNVILFRDPRCVTNYFEKEKIKLGKMADELQRMKPDKIRNRVICTLGKRKSYERMIKKWG